MIKSLKVGIAYLLLWCFPVSILTPSYAQNVGSSPVDATRSAATASGSSDTPSTVQAILPPVQTPAPIEFGTARPMDSESPVQNAIIEGVQVSSEPTEKTDEKVISCYFIFRDKPTSYFYEIKPREKKLVFEFNDTRTGAAPVPSVGEAPIKGFSIEQKKVDINKEVRGLTPEWHDMIRVTFDLDAVPDIHVNDEYSIISFSYKWTSNPSKMTQYTVKDKTPKVVLWSGAGLVGLGGGVLAYFLFGRDKAQAPMGPIPIDDLPSRPNP